MYRYVPVLEITPPPPGGRRGGEQISTNVIWGKERTREDAKKEENVKGGTEKYLFNTLYKLLNAKERQKIKWN